MTRFRVSLSHGLAAACLLGALGAHAQEAAPAPAAAPAAEPAAPEQRGGIEEIIVTAQKREQSAQEVPIAITAISAELQTSAIRDLRDLNGFSPNVRIDRDPARANGAAITIRGISPTRTDDNSFDSPIAVMIDDIYLGTLSGQVLENFDIQQVEILRGPQGTLFGKNTVGGVLNVRRTVPTGDWGARLKFTAGSFGQREYRAVLNAPILDEKLAAKFFFTKIGDKGWIENTTLDRRVPKKDYMNYGATFLATPTDSIRAVFTIERFEDDSEGGGSLTNYNLLPGVASPPSDPREPDLSGGFLACTLFNSGIIPEWNGGGVPCRTSLKRPKKVSADLPNPASLTTDAYTLDVSIELSENFTFASVTGYRKVNEDRILDFDGSSVDHITLERLNDYDQFSQESRIHADFDRIKGVAGFYYWNSEFSQDWVTGGDFWTQVGTLSGWNLANNTWTNPPPLPTPPFPPNAFRCMVGAVPCSTFFGTNQGLGPLQVCQDPSLPGFPFGATRCDSDVLASGDGNSPGTGLGPKLTQRLYETQETTSFAFFTQADWEIIEDLTLTVGVRWTKETKDFRAGQAYLSSVERNKIRNFPAYADLEKTWTDVSPKAALAWQPADDVLLFLSYSEGFHSGGFFGVNQNIADFVRDQYDPEYARSYEIGAKTQWFDNRVQLNGSFFYNQFRNKQESAVQFDPTTNTVATVFANVADAVYQGIDLELRVAPIEQLDVFLSFGWLDAEYRDFFTDINPNDTATTTLANCPGTFIPSVPPPGGQCIEDATFLRPRNAPKYTVGVGGTVRQEIGNGTAEFTLKYNWLSEIETSLINLTVGRLDTRGDLQITAGYQYKNVSVMFFARNLTNEGFEIPFLIQPLFASGTIVPGRTYGFDLTVELGGD